MADRERALNIVCAKCYRFPCLVVFFRATYAIMRSRIEHGFLPLFKYGHVLLDILGRLERGLLFETNGW